MGMQLKVEVEGPSLESLSIKLAEALQTSFNAQGDAASYLSQAQRERTKVDRLTDLIERIKERDFLRARGEEPVAKRRMDPMLTYNLTDVEGELSRVKARVLEFEKKAASYQSLAESSRFESQRLQVEIQRLRK